MDVYLIFLNFVSYVTDSGFNFGSICIFILSIYLIYLSTPRNMQHSMMQSYKTSLGFLKPYNFLDGEIQNLAMPRCVSYIRTPKFKVFDLGFGGVRGCAVSPT